MSGSEIARIKETIAREYMAAKWGLIGFAQGAGKHVFISTRMQRIEEGRKELEALVGDKATELAVETLESVPEEPTRQHIQEMLLHELGNTADTEHLLDILKDVWKTFDLLIMYFGMEDACKMINALP